MGESYLKVGNYTQETEGSEANIDRAYFRQGWIFKDEEAFLFHPEKVCYVPELSDEGYTRKDFLKLCNGQEEFACECFYAVDWQSPATWIDEQYRDQEWQYCPQCEKIYDMSGVPCVCPLCGTDPEEVEHADTESERRPAEPGGL